MHPDKVGDTPETRSKFHELQQAHETLIDSTKRSMYDQYGDKGVAVFENFNNVDPEAVARAMMQEAPLSLKLGITCIFCFSLLFVLLSVSKSRALLMFYLFSLSIFNTLSLLLSVIKKFSSPSELITW
jgi:curved DNA-binding protein CbpA